VNNPQTKALVRLAALFGEGYPTAKLEAGIKNKQLRVIAPAGANPFVLNLISQLRTSKKLSTVQLVLSLIHI
jgi:hypothetical protein